MLCEPVCIQAQARGFHILRYFFLPHTQPCTTRTLCHEIPTLAPHRGTPVLIGSTKEGTQTMLTPKNDQRVAKIMTMLQTLQTVHTAEKGITKDITLMQVQAVKVELQHHNQKQTRADKHRITCLRQVNLNQDQTQTLPQT